MENAMEVFAAPSEQVVNLKWFLFDQNNSGGYYVTDDYVASKVWIQARNAEEAISRMEAILENTDLSYCDCCGPRWSPYVWDADGRNEPMHYMWRPAGESMSVPLRLAFREHGTSWAGVDAMLYAFDGRKVKYTIPEADDSEEHQARIAGLKALGFDA